MADIALTDSTVIQKRSSAVRRSGYRDTRFRLLTFFAAVIVLVIFAGVLASLGLGAWPAIKAFGLPFVWTEAWNPVTENSALWLSVYGTLITSFIAMLIAVPVGLSASRFFSPKICPSPAAPADRHRHRIACGHSQHHLRHLGLVRLRTLSSSPSVAAFG